jgi:hypothetical protein
MLTRFALFVVALMLPLRAQDVIISEFLADNEDGIADDDGTRQDWIELRNTTGSSASLAGHFLTDDALIPAKWPFPPVSIPAGGALIVWASEKDRRDPGRALHTNFKLARGGEYLALIKPDLTPASAFAPAYPPQYEDVSYGASQSQAPVTLIDKAASLRWLIPTAGTLDVNQGNNAAPWTTTTFNDTAWTTGPQPLVYGLLATDPYEAATVGGTNIEATFWVATPGTFRSSLYLRAPFTIADASAVGALKLRVRTDDAFIAYMNGVFIPVAEFNEPDSPVWNSVAPAEYPDVDPSPTAPESAWRTFTLSSSSLLTGNNVLCLHAFNVARNATVANNDFFIQAELTGTTSDGTLAGTYAYFTNPSPSGLNVNGVTAPGPSINGTTNNPTPPVVPALTAIADSQAQFSGTQGQSGWSYGYNAFAPFAAAPANVYDPATFTAFAGGSAAGAYNSNFTTPAAVAPFNYWTGSAWDLNTAGAAPWTLIGPLNTHPSDSTPATQPLHAVIRRYTATTAGSYVLNGYFTRPATTGNGTHGRVFHNSTELSSALVLGSTSFFAHPVTLAPGDTLDLVVDVGPTDDDASDTTISYLRIVEPPTATTTLLITAQVERTVRPVASVSLRFRVMYNAEVTVPMLDDGLNGDAVAGDRIYSARPDISLTTPGQMIRWRVVATDDLGNASTDPPYPDPADSPRYWGTIIADPSTATSQAPVLHWFPESGDGQAGTLIGSRSAVYYGGEFYDNIYTNRHGQSTGGFAKKSLNLNFNHDYGFRFDPAHKRTGGVDLLSNWADKSKIRNALMWEAYRLSGSPAHLSFPVRVQLNGSFYALYDLIENANDSYLERAGLDPAGALYKMYNTLNSASSGVEKKTRESENNTDLAALITGINTATALNTRRTYGYDNIDIPALVNYLAVTALTINNDQGHKNYYLFRDYDKTREWKVLPWDCDLSLGHTFTGNSFAANPPQLGAGYFDDLIDSGRSVQLGPINNLKLFCYNVPEINQMFVRRLRTLMDQWLVSETSTTGFFETRAAALLDQLDPPGLGTASDTWLDGQRWGVWTTGRNVANANGATTIAATAANFAATWALHNPRASAGRIIDPNGNPVTADAATSPYPTSLYYPGGTVTNAAAAPGPYSLTYAAQTYPPFGAGATSIHPFLKGRRLKLYDILNTFSDRDNSTATTTDRDFIPEAQPTVPDITFDAVEFNPATLGQDTEYFILKNNGTTHIDVSLWTITGAINYTLPGGTVIPAPNPTSTLPDAANIGLLHIAKKPSAFRARTTGPRGGQNRLIVGGYSGQMSARGETLELRDPAGTLIATNTYTPAPSPLQSALRISEILYNPADPTPAELAVNALLQSPDFEWIELLNTGAAPIDLTGATFTEGISFTFPAHTLPPGARVLVVANPTAFALRYPANTTPVLGPWIGRLDDGGEQIHLNDATGESVLEFAYDGAWLWPADNAGHSLVLTNPAASYTTWDLEDSWTPSLSLGGTPGETNNPGLIYRVWQRTRFTAIERPDPLIGAPTVDLDADSVTNLLEYAFAADPHVADIAALPTASTVTVGPFTHQAITFRRQKNAIDLEYLPEYSTDLAPGTWTIATTIEHSVTDHGDGTETVTQRESAPAGFGGPRRLYRIRVVLTQP